MLSAKQFGAIANELQEANMGRVVTLQMKAHSRQFLVFIKKPPEEMADVLTANPDLCSLEHYTNKYNSPVSKSVSLGVRHQLASMGIVPAKLLK